jgi:outer membrane biosynthesis protein TonB
MALSDDQRAMLRLLAQREQGYEDLAALMGLSVDEVRAKVKDALDALEEGEVAPPLPPEPVETPPAAPDPPKPEPPAAEEPAPAPVKPPEPAAAKAAPPSPAAKRPSSSRPRISLPSGQGARAAIAAGIAVVALIVVVVIVSGGSGSDTSTSATTATTPSESTTAATATTAANSDKETQAVLSEVGGSGASGSAVFGRVKNSLALQVIAEGLEPTTKGKSYTVWVADSPQKMLPLASTEVPKSGKIGAQFEVPTEVLAYLAKGTFDEIVVTATDEAQLKASLTKATKEKKSPIYTGTAVLRGPITGPVVGAALKEKK